MPSQRRQDLCGSVLDQASGGTGGVNAPINSTNTTTTAPEHLLDNVTQRFSIFTIFLPLVYNRTRLVLKEMSVDKKQMSVNEWRELRD